MSVGTALGISSPSIVPVLGHIGQAAEHHELDMRSMNAALWQVGWGYYLSNMMGFDGTGLTTPILAWARDHFVNHVRSGGPYPASALRPPALRRAAGDLARRVEAAGRPGAGIRLRFVAARSPA